MLGGVMAAAHVISALAQIPYLYDSIKGAFSSSQNMTGPEGLMASDDALSSFLNQGQRQRDLVFQENALGPLLQSVQKRTRFGTSRGLPDLMSQVSTQNFIGQRARRLGELSQPVDETPDLLEMAHRLGLPIQ